MYKDKGVKDDIELLQYDNLIDGFDFSAIFNRPTKNTNKWIAENQIFMKKINSASFSYKTYLFWVTL